MDRRGEAGLPLLMNRDMLDRLIVARLIESPPTDYPQTPVQYLLGCYQRADDELRNRTVAGSAQLSGTEQCCRDLVVNYAGLTLSGGIVPHLGAQVCVCLCLAGEYTRREALVVPDGAVVFITGKSVPSIAPNVLSLAQ